MKTAATVLPSLPKPPKVDPTPPLPSPEVVAAIARLDQWFTLAPRADLLPSVGATDPQAKNAVRRLGNTIECCLHERLRGLFNDESLTFEPIGDLLIEELTSAVQAYGGTPAVGNALFEAELMLRRPGSDADQFEGPGLVVLGEVRTLEGRIAELSSALPESVRRAGVLPPGRLVARRDELIEQSRLAVATAARSRSHQFVANTLARGTSNLHGVLERWVRVADAAVLVPEAFAPGFLESWSSAPVRALTRHGLDRLGSFILRVN